MTADDTAHLAGAELAWRTYRPRNRTCLDPDHYAFCGATFATAEQAAQLSEETPVLGEGYTTTASHRDGAGYHWICAGCYEALNDEFEWRLVA
jgi:hypothetical protein